jgi:hypothetical protein
MQNGKVGEGDVFKENVFIALIALKISEQFSNSYIEKYKS